MSGSHETYDRRHEHQVGSNRSLGLVFSVFFFVAGVLPLGHGQPLRLWALSLSAAFLSVALIRADWLAPLNRFWIKFSVLLSNVSNTIILAVLFFAVFSPVALALRLLRRDLLRLRFDASLPSYWLPREPPGPSPEGMSRQF